VDCGSDADIRIFCGWMRTEGMCTIFTSVTIDLFCAQCSE
jgi:hypothetical protein